MKEMLRCYPGEKINQDLTKKILEGRDYWSI